MRTLVPIGLAVLLATPAVAPAQSPDSLARSPTVPGPAHTYKSPVRPMLHQRWEPEHVVLATTSTTFILLDWITSADAIRRCGRDLTCVPSVEQNPLLGRSPSLTTLRTWSLIGLSGNLVGGALLRRRWMRTAWFTGVTMIEFAIVQHNVRAGLHLTLHF
jgi:hypothetical protein